MPGCGDDEPIEVQQDTMNPDQQIEAPEEGGCGPPSDLEDELLYKENGEGEEEVNKANTCCVILIVIFSVPALIGACCWPTLVLGLFSLAEPAWAYEFSHAFSAAMTIVMVLSFWIWLVYKKKLRKGSKINIWGPLFFQTLALFLVPIVPVWKTGSDMGWANKWGVWRPKCDGGMKCLSFWGWVATVGGTWFGNLCMAIAMGWQMDIMKKLKQRIRKAQRTGKCSDDDHQDPVSMD